MAEKLPRERIQAITFPPPPVLPEPDGGPDPGLARMNLNEAAYPPSPKALAAAADALANANRYPDHGCSPLAAVIGDRTGIPLDRISFGNGSAEILVALAILSINEGDEAILPSPTFPTCGKGVQIAGGTIVNVPLRGDGVNDVPAMLAEITGETRLFYICSPNNPTGGILTASELKEAAQGVPDSCLLVVDEAYYEFSQKEGGPDVLSILADREEPWVVTRSFSKAYCLAGMRIGYALASDAELQKGLWQLRPNFNIGRASLAAATAAMLDEVYLQKMLARTIAERRRLGEGLQKLGFELLPSFANFLTARPPGPAQTIADDLVSDGILVQALGWPDANGALRITIDTSENTDRILAALANLG